MINRQSSIGEAFYNTDSQKIYIYNGNEWLLISDSQPDTSPVLEPKIQRCPYCEVRILDPNQTHCKSCGAPL
jgi:hypothetical protein